MDSTYKKVIKRATIFTTALILILACSFSSSPGLPTSSPAPADSGGSGDSSQPGSGDSVEVVTIDGEVIELPRPVPDAVQAMQDRIESGQVSEAEGVVQLLELFAGATDPDHVFGGQPVVLDGGYGASMMALSVLASDAPEDQKAQIRALLNSLAPTRTNLAPYSMPESQARRSPGLLASLTQQTVPCESLVADGFPDDPDDPPLCFLYRSFNPGGQEFRVYYPVEMSANPNLMQRVDAAVQALQDSHARLSPLAALPNIDLVFTMLSSAATPSAYASVPLGDQALFAAGCPISVYPSSLDESIENVKFFIAHEVWHCISGLRRGQIQYDVTKWYTEGMAEYFANLVYPTNNFEHQRLPSFHLNSVTEPITGMSYDAFIFFQYLESRTGPEFMIRLLDALPTSGSITDQNAVLGSIEDMDSLFHEFGEAYLLRQIQDTGGGVLPGPPIFYIVEDDRYQIEEEREVTLAADVFVVARYIMEFRSGYEYQITKEEGGRDGKNSWRNPDQSSFMEIPSSVKILCDEQWLYMILLTSVEDSGATILNLGFKSEEEDRLHCCLIGTWEQPTDEIRSNLQSIFSGGGPTLVDLEGRFVVTINEEHQMFFQPEGYRGTFIFDEEEPPVTVAVSGGNISRYHVPREGEIRISNEAPAFVVTMSADGASVNYPLPAESLTGGLGEGTWSYTCSDTTFIASTEGQAPFPDSTFTRISEVPMTPEPEESEAPSPSDPGPGDIGSPPVCASITASDFSVNSGAVSWNLNNGSLDFVEISQISMDWPDVNGAWEAIDLSGVPIWAGSKDLSPAIIQEGWLVDPAGLNLSPSSATALVMHFSDENLGSTGYILVVEFSNGCILSDVR
jgi:hypothetical protein